MVVAGGKRDDRAIQNRRVQLLSALAALVVVFATGCGQRRQKVLTVASTEFECPREKLTVSGQKSRPACIGNNCWRRYEYQVSGCGHQATIVCESGLCECKGTDGGPCPVQAAARQQRLYNQGRLFDRDPNAYPETRYTCRDRVAVFNPKDDWDGYMEAGQKVNVGLEVVRERHLRARVETAHGPRFGLIPAAQLCSSPAQPLRAFVAAAGRQVPAPVRLPDVGEIVRNPQRQFLHVFTRRQMERHSLRSLSTANAPASHRFKLRAHGATFTVFGDFEPLEEDMPPNKYARMAVLVTVHEVVDEVTPNGLVIKRVALLAEAFYTSKRIVGLEVPSEAVDGN